MVQLNQNFIDTITQELPAHLSMDEFIAACDRPLRRSIRVNTLKISSDDFKTLMQPKGWTFDPIPWCEDGFWISYDEEEQLGNALEHIQGLFYIQEASSMLPPTALFTPNALFTPSAKWQCVLDLASAPGSKTTQMAALMQNQGLLVANEYSASRVKVLHANVLRMGASHCALTHFDGRVFGEYLYESFDAVLIDAPCGGEGTVRKDADALKHWSLDDVLAISETQKALIESAFLALKPGGSLVYSTCTLNRLENQGVCEYLKQVYGDAVQFESLSDLFDGADRATTPEGFLHVWPQIYDSEGFFVAKLTKTASVPRLQPEPKLQKNFPFTPASAKQAQGIKDYFQQDLGISLPDELIMVRDDEFWLFPHEFNAFIGRMRFQRIGIKLADNSKHGFKVRHEAIIALAGKQLSPTAKTVDVSDVEAKEYLMGRDIALNTAVKAQGEVIVCYGGAPLGMAKHLGNKLKNNLPRDLVKDKVLLLPEQTKSL
ncbi:MULTISPECIES: 16S rRNA (cytosine(1407)-C(5))-methyltransferase RsmF [unclassified Shewanella]|uniref:16S rRNA (cytosine(1407)-C(5))-methyltransferase RsmF n=1 Tax=unclassified Shewanella TaxID=196818 RepID=UPI0021D955BF|nr:MULTISPECIES: 16S rRNA (cytosine(1407)-C(5))-methyltransferase RsmF [unclassified Shewanella]MCU8003900.1 16S rRNA (cytosine(1407)-C(5))-methyltransferase RsmF [Shewanella sp. SM96]MCU8060576.1 16S rRNA (cytosine(1407)-C(5))-methyltransferase RsmF [Shewanella sp. SM55]